MRHLPALLVLLAAPTAPSTAQNLSYVDAGADARASSGETPSCFTLQPPDENWRQLTLSELRSLNVEAQVGLAGPQGVRALLLAKTSNRVDLAACVQDLLDDQHLEQVKQLFAEPTRVDGRPAAHALVSGRSKGTWWRYHATAFRNGRELYLMLSWGHSDDVPADGSTFIAATRGLQRVAGVGLEELRRGGSGLDADGPGWRVRDGILRDAALGFELAPRGAWRVATRRELAPLGPEVQAGLIDELHDALFAVVAERVPGVEAADYADQCRVTALSRGHQAGSRDARIAGFDVELRLITLPGPSGYADETERGIFGVFVEGERCFQILARFPASSETAMERSLPQALASMRLLDEPERMALDEQMRAAPAALEAVGDSWSLRRGVFTDYIHGFRWRLPAGYWEVAVSPAKALAEGAPNLRIQERGLGVHGWIRAEPGDTFTGAEGHERALEALVAGRKRSVISDTRELQLGDLAGQLSRCELKDPVQPEHALLASAGDDERGFRICFQAPQQALERHAEPIAAAIAGLRISARRLAPTEMISGLYRDARMGFELEAPDPSWRFRERKLDRFGVRAEAAQGVIVSFEGPGGARLHASAAWVASGPGGLDQSIVALVPTALESALGLPAEGPRRDERATFRGQPCRLLAWQDGERQIELVILKRDRSAYAVAVEGDASSGAVRDWLAGFRLLD